MEDDLRPVDARHLGKWLQYARKAAGKSQQAAAEFLNVARTTITAMEKGERRVQPIELVRLSQFYGRQISDLLRPSEPDEAFAVQLRAAIAPHEDVSADLTPVAAEFEQLCEDYVELERMTRSDPIRRYPPERSVPKGEVERAAEDIAVEERHRLGLGDGPIENLRETLEQDVGIRIFSIQMPSRVDAMFAFSERLGACMAVNAKHPDERKRNSLAHEYGHFLTSRRQSEIQLTGQFARVPAAERFANAFARSFLMPAPGLGRRFNEIKRSRAGIVDGSGGVTVADLLILAHYFFVSFEALTRRLEELRLITSGTMDRLRQSQFVVREARNMIGVAERPRTDAMLPVRYTYLALQAHRDGLLSEGRLARFLRVDRVQARALTFESEPARPISAAEPE